MTTNKHEGKRFDFDNWDVSYTNYDTGVVLDCPECREPIEVDIAIPSVKELREVAWKHWGKGDYSEVDELRMLFDLQIKRSEEAAALWRAEDPENRSNVFPDLSELLGWLMRQITIAKTALLEERKEVRLRGEALADAENEHCGCLGGTLLKWAGNNNSEEPVKENSPAYVHDLLSAFLYRTTLDFGTHHVPLDIQNRLKKAVEMGVMGTVPLDEASDRSAVQYVRNPDVVVYRGDSEEPVSTIPGEKFIRLSEIKPVLDAYTEFVTPDHSLGLGYRKRVDTLLKMLGKLREKFAEGENQ